MSNYGAYGAPTLSYGAPVVGVDPTAVMGRRIGAYFIDAILVTIVMFAIVLAGFFALKPYHKVTGLSKYSDGASGWCDANYNGSGADNKGFCFGSDNDTAYVLDGGNLGTLYGLLWGGSLLCWVLDLVLLQGLTGASVGKFLVGLRVVKHDGAVCGIGRALLRSVLLIVDGFCFALVGLISSFTSKGHRRVGDMAASTLVVRKEQVGRPVVVAGLTAPEIGAPYPGAGYPPGGGYAPPGYAPGGGYAPPGYQPPGYQQPVYSPPSNPQQAAWTEPASDPQQPASSSPSDPQQPASSSPSDPQQAGWAEPVQGEPAQAPGPSTTPPGAPTGDGPHWDEARNAYITYDRSRSAWLEYDQATGSWGPISQ